VVLFDTMRVKRRVFQRQLLVCPKRSNVARRRVSVICRVLRRSIKRVFKKRECERATSHVRQRIKRLFKRKVYELAKSYAKRKMHKKRLPLLHVHQRRRKRRAKQQVQHSDFRIASIKNCIN
jgi:hypothetical protein